MVHSLGGQKFHFNETQIGSQNLFLRALRSIDHSEAIASDQAALVVLRQIEVFQRFLLSTGCVETGILTDSKLASVLWIASIVSLAHAALLHSIKKTTDRSSSQAYFCISLWLLFMHLNVKQPQRRWVLCPSCRKWECRNVVVSLVKYWSRPV